MDDGCRSRSAVYLSTQQFVRADQVRLLEMLRAQWGVDGALNRDKRYFRIRLTVDGAERFVPLIDPYLLDDMRYKLPHVTP